MLYAATKHAACLVLPRQSSPRRPSTCDSATECSSDSPISIRDSGKEQGSGQPGYAGGGAGSAQSQSHDSLFDDDEEEEEDFNFQNGADRSEMWESCAEDDQLADDQQKDDQLRKGKGDQGGHRRLRRRPQRHKDKQNPGARCSSTEVQRFLDALVRHDNASSEVTAARLAKVLKLRQAALEPGEDPLSRRVLPALTVAAVIDNWRHNFAEQEEQHQAYQDDVKMRGDAAAGEALRSRFSSMLDADYGGQLWVELLLHIGTVDQAVFDLVSGQARDKQGQASRQASPCEESFAFHIATLWAAARAGWQ
jgi:hypothetical protein